MCSITFVTTPGTEFSTGKSNDLVILKNFEKHDIFISDFFSLYFFFLLLITFSGTSSQTISSCSTPVQSEFLLFFSREKKKTVSKMFNVTVRMRHLF